MSDAVVVSWMFPEMTSGWFTYSMVDMMRYDSAVSRYMCQADGGIISLSTGPRIAEARNQIVDVFADQHPNADWLLMLDSDMTFSADLLDRLMDVADPEKVPIVGGLCFAGGKKNDPYPTVYRLTQQGEGDSQYASIDRVYDYPRNALVKVGATGGACLLMHRGVLAAMKVAFDKTPDGRPNAYPWFQEGIIGPNGEPWGEDILFCLRANQLGIPVHVHTGVKLGHVKHHIIDETYYDNYRRSAELTEAGLYDTEHKAKPNRAQRRAEARKKVRV